MLKEKEIQAMEIQIEGLCKYYVSEGKTVKALDQVDLTIPANKIFTLLGPSGCGKTTLLRCIAGLEAPDAGEIRIGGDVVWSGTKGIFVPPEKRELGMVFQTYAIWPHMSVFDNIAYPLQVRGVHKNVIRDKVANVLRFVQLESVERRSATKLSGGQQQRVALARALVAEPKAILFDEPLSNLDAKLRERTRKELRKFLRDLDITALYVTHDRVEALALSDRIAVLQAGKIVEMDSPQEIYFNAKHRYVADFIGRANQISATVLSHDGSLTLIETGMGPISCQRHELPEGSQATLCIRPEFINITERGPEIEINALEGKVEGLEFVGEVYEAEIRIGAERLLVRIDPDIEVRESDKVRMYLEPQHCMLLSA
jgi:iron(III) transport system ATP-binding protein